MTMISPLQNIHSEGSYGNFENKTENELLKISELKNLLIVQIVQYKKSLVSFESVDIDGLKLKNEPLTVVFNGTTRIMWNGPKNWLLVSTKKDFIGKRSLNRSAFTSTDREKLVGVVPIDKTTSIPEGSYIVKDPKAKLPNPKLGHVSASCWSVEYDNPFSLAIIKDGKNMIGQKLFAMSPLKNKTIPVEIVSSHYVDPEGKRVRS